jgi:hypothetical protein
MSLTTHEYDKQNYQLKKPNIHRRYILESPIHSTTNRNSNKHKQQIKTENSRSNEDPWVKELLERDIDFSKLDQQEEEIQLLDISQHLSYHQFNNQQNLQTKVKHSSQPIYSSQSKFNNLFSFFLN